MDWLWHLLDLLLALVRGGVWGFTLFMVVLAVGGIGLGLYEAAVSIWRRPLGRHDLPCNHHWRDPRLHDTGPMG